MATSEQLAQAMKLAREALAVPGARILILGGRTTNFSDVLRRSERLVFWDSTDPKTVNKAQIPESVGLVLSSKFVAHKLTNRVGSMTDGNIKVFPFTLETGQLRMILSEALNPSAHSDEIVQPDKTEFVEGPEAPAWRDVRAYCKEFDDPREAEQACMGRWPMLNPGKVSIIVHGLSGASIEAVSVPLKEGEIETVSKRSFGQTSLDSSVLQDELARVRVELGRAQAELGRERERRRRLVEKGRVAIAQRNEARATARMFLGQLRDVVAQIEPLGLRIVIAVPGPKK